MKDSYNIPNSVVDDWQMIVDILAEIIGIPAALIMRIVDDDIEVFIASNSDHNPYNSGNREHLKGSGLYCENVILSKRKLLVPNALKDEDWKNNPDVKLNMISYLGFPISFPDGTPFGTLCVLDNKENEYSELQENLMTKMQSLIHSQLALIYMNSVLSSENRRLTDYISEIQTLRDIVPICSYCKKIRDDDGYWKSVEEYFTRYTKSEFSHGICPDCRDKYFGTEYK